MSRRLASDHWFDFLHQAWVVNGVYADCGHLFPENCQCYGRLHRGEAPGPEALREHYQGLELVRKGDPMKFAPQPVRFHGPNGDTLLVFPVEAPETCPQCGQRCCVFLEREPRNLCLTCAASSLTNAESARVERFPARR